MPNLTILQTIFVGAQCGQETQLGTDAEVRYDDIQGLVEELILANL